MCGYKYVYIYMYMIDIWISKYVLETSNVCYLFPFNPGSTLDVTYSSPASDLQIRRGTGDGLIPWTVRVGMSNLSLKAEYVIVLAAH